MALRNTITKGFAFKKAFEKFGESFNNTARYYAGNSAPALDKKE